LIKIKLMAHIKTVNSIKRSVLPKVSWFSMTSRRDGIPDYFLLLG
jgi:hypothetical protein